MSFRNGVIPTSPDDDRRLHFILIISQQEEWDAPIAFACRMVFYVGILTLLIMIVTLISKLLRTLNEEGGGGGGGRAPAAVTESSTLLPKYEEAPFSYGTCGEGDLESGNSSSGDAYDEKVCVVCYDHRRNCFFVPCGHSATCSVCALRIVEMESKTCPVCRRPIRKVRKLLVS